jgi:hypothetical protein
MKRRTAAEHFFSEEEKERIKATTRDVESRTIGQIVVMIVGSSDPYPEADLLGGSAPRVFGVIHSDRPFLPFVDVVLRPDEHCLLFSV